MIQTECKHLDIRSQDKKGYRYRCKDCGKWFTDKTLPVSIWKPAPDVEAPKVLVFDTENAPTEAYVFNMWNQNIMPAQINSDWFMLSWSAKWLNDSQMMGDVLTSQEAKAETDHRLMRGLWNLMNEADVVIAHNAAQFDIPVVNTRFAMNDMAPPSPYLTIDTLRVARKQFRFAHNKLSFLADRFKIPHNKLETEFGLWKRCRAGEYEALQYMLKYNKMDVTVLEELYLKLRPWIKNHPNFNLYAGTDGKCSTCGSDKLKRNGSYTTTVNRYNSYQCKKCKSYSRTGKSENKTGMRSVAK